MAIEYSVDSDVLALGTACWVRVGNNASDAKEVGFVDSFRATKNMELQEAKVCGTPLPASIDATGIRVSISLSGFLATKQVYEGTQEFNGGGKISLASFNPDDEDFVAKQTITKFPYIDFYDKKHDAIISSFKQAMSESFGITGNGGSYIKADISMRAIKMSSGKDYTTTAFG